LFILIIPQAKENKQLKDLPLRILKITIKKEGFKLNQKSRLWQNLPKPTSKIITSKHPKTRH
jgi:hypothetical protein